MPLQLTNQVVTETPNGDLHARQTKRRRTVLIFALIVLMGATVGVSPTFAQTYISAEPIPSQDIVGAGNLNQILSIGYPNLELWSQRLLGDCHVVQNVIDVLSFNQTISTVNPGNTRYIIAAGGFEGVTDPTYVLTMKDSGANGASAADIFTLNNALGYVLNQSGTAQFNLVYNSNNPFEFALDYGVVTYGGHLSGEHAMDFFNYLGTIDPALWTGANAGFTQVNISNSPLNNYRLDDSMLFLIGSVSKQEFVQGLFKAANTAPNMTYSPIGASGKPTTGQAGVAFPGNDWIASPGGAGYLVNLGNPSPALLKELQVLRLQHLQAVTNLLKAIGNANVGFYLIHQFKCP